jgi:hypothetical protein
VGDARLERATSGSGDIEASNTFNNLEYLTHQIPPNNKLLYNKNSPYVNLVGGIFCRYLRGLVFPAGKRVREKRDAGRIGWNIGNESWQAF